MLLVFFFSYITWLLMDILYIIKLVGNDLSCEYLSETAKKFDTALMVYSGPWEKLIHEKNQK